MEPSSANKEQQTDQNKFVRHNKKNTLEIFIFIAVAADVFLYIIDHFFIIYTLDDVFYLCYHFASLMIYTGTPFILAFCIKKNKTLRTLVLIFAVLMGVYGASRFAVPFFETVFR